MEFGLTKEQRGWVSRAELLAKEFAPRARQYDEAAAFPVENFERLRQEGFLTLAVPRKYGGEGVDQGYPDFLPLQVAEAIAAGCGSTGWNLQTHYEHCGLVFRMGNEAQHRRVFGDVIKKGSLLGSLGSEVNPEQLTAPQDIATRFTVGLQLSPAPGGLRANGMKHFCSVTPAAGFGMLWGMAPGTSTMADGLVLCVVPTDSPGLTLLDSGWKECIGLRASVSWSAKIEDVFIPWDNVLGEPGDFVQKDPYTFELAYTAVTLGVAQGAFDFLLGFLKERSYLLKDDTVAYVVGEMDSALQATRMSVRCAHALWAEERHAEAQLASIRALHTARETALLVTNKGFEVCGTRSLFKFHPLERAWRDVRALTLHTRESQLMRLLVEGRLSGDFLPKQKYGPRLEKRKTWADLGVLTKV